MNKCPICEGTAFDVYHGVNAYHSGGVSVDCIKCGLSLHLTREELISAALTSAASAAKPELRRCCPDCGAGIVIGQKIAVCEANKYSSRSGAGDCRWELALTPDLRRQADEALAAQGASGVAA